MFKGGHAVFLEQPDAFEAALSDFMERAAIASLRT
jgi:pimeloyl-ACP methyl ester carboxylesterase